MSTNFTQLFTKLENWRLHQFNPQLGIRNPVDNAYLVQLQGQNSRNKNINLEAFETLLQDSQVNQLQALICLIDYSRGNKDTLFGSALEALCDANDKLSNLKALFIGDGEEHEYRKSKLDVFDIRPILEAYPNLEVLQIRGYFVEYMLECDCLKHKHLKTLVIETADLSRKNLDQICTLELPALEYLELWLGRQLRESIIDNLSPILFGESFPNLRYLGLRSSECTNQLAQAIVQSPIINRLTILDLSMGTLTDEGAKILLNCPAINQLLTLNVSNNYLSTAMIEQLSQLNCQVIANPQDREDSGNRYYALHE
jgi:hypothetical protein